MHYPLIFLSLTTVTKKYIKILISIFNKESDGKVKPQHWTLRWSLTRQGLEQQIQLPSRLLKQNSNEPFLYLARMWNEFFELLKSHNLAGLNSVQQKQLM